MDAGLEYVVVGPARMNADAGGRKRVRVIPRSQYVAGMAVTRDDLASVVIGAAGLPDAANRTFSVINTEEPADASWLEALASMPQR
jgi:protein-disulfide isomerase-like protein with CxxC motif